MPTLDCHVTAPFRPGAAPALQGSAPGVELPIARRRPALGQMFGAFPQGPETLVTVCGPAGLIGACSAASLRCGFTFHHEEFTF